jgi:hypothetical protein
VVLLLAFLSGAMVAGALRYSLEAAWVLVALAGLAAAAFAMVTSSLLVSSLVRREGVPKKAAATVFVLLVPLATGLFLALAVSTQFFRSEIRADYIEAHFRDIADLERSTADLARTIANPPRVVVDQDPQVEPLVRALKTADDELDAAEAAYLCEIDGTCGTKRAGKGPAAGEKLQEVKRCTDDRRKAAEALDTARGTVRPLVDAAAARTVAAAQARLDVEQPRLSRLYTDRALVESGQTQIAMGERIGTLTRVFTRQPVPVAFLFLFVLFAYLAPHVVPLLMPRDDDGIEFRHTMKNADLAQNFHDRQQAPTAGAPQNNGSAAAPSADQAGRA